MKKLKYNIKFLLPVIIVLSFFTKDVAAQMGEVGIRFMPTFSRFDLQSSDRRTVEGEVTLGFGAGGLLGYHFNDRIGIQGEFIYSSSSQKYTELNVERQVKLKYFNIPLLLSLNTGKSKMVNLNLVAGPQIGISAGSSIKISGGGVTTPGAILSVKKGDLGFAYGLGIDFGINTLHTLRFSLGYRGVSGLFDISDNNRTIANDSFYILDRTRVRSHSGYIGLSFLF